MAQLPDSLHPDDPRPEVQRALRVWLALQRHYVFRPLLAREHLGTATDPEAVLRDRAGVEPAPDAEVARLRRCGAALVPFGSRAYPPRLARLEDAPAALLVRGEVATLRRRSVAIVGARAATAYGRSCARRFAAALARSGATVVSGLALGIDGEAHAAALEAGGTSIGVQACGPDRVYPARHTRLAERLRGQGAVVTEFPIAVPPRAPHFPLRNRLISALAEAVLVVEARVRSGTLTTARHAADQGIDVWAVPGPIDGATSEGPNRLLAEGAAVAESPEALLSALDLVDESAASVASPEPEGDAGRVWRALARRPRSRDELVEATGLPAERVGAALVALELGGRTRLDRDGRHRRISPPPGPELS